MSKSKKKRLKNPMARLSSQGIIDDWLRNAMPSARIAGPPLGPLVERDTLDLLLVQPPTGDELFRRTVEAEKAADWAASERDYWKLMYEQRGRYQGELKTSLDELRGLVLAFQEAEDAFFSAEGNVAILDAESDMKAAKRRLSDAIKETP